MAKEKAFAGMKGEFYGIFKNFEKTSCRNDWKGSI